MKEDYLSSLEMRFRTSNFAHILIAERRYQASGHRHTVENQNEAWSIREPLLSSRCHIISGK
jgi:hypothetical protein